MKKNGKILVVDDQDDFLLFLRIFLTENGYDVLTSNNVKEAVSLFRKMDPDLVISDWYMPFLGGRELLTLIKEIRQEAHIMIMSGFHLEMDDITRLDKNISIWLKSSDFKSLLDKIEKSLSLRETAFGSKQEMKS
ncbi:MAG: response regulator [Oligoflexales bacterium]|nr:response regulator [Oligoflexales bacterium]